MPLLFALLGCDGPKGSPSGGCDGAITTVYADEDGDGFGDPATAAEACGTAAGAVTDGTDCDDGDAGVNPDVSEDACDDGVDQDCDGDDPGCALSGEISLGSATRLSSSRANDNTGILVREIGRAHV